MLVLNNSRIPGLAAKAASDLRRIGWPVAGTGNLTGRLSVTTVFYAPGQEAAARRLIARNGDIARMLPRPPGLPGSGLTLVVTRYYPH